MGETLITEEYAAGMLKKMLPADLPVENVRVAISGNGLVAVAATADPGWLSGLSAALRGQYGLKGNLFLSMLPKQTPLVVAFRCTGGESGKIQLSPAALRVNGTELDPGMLPQDLCQGISQTVNQVLQQTGVEYSTIGFRNGAFVLQ